MEPIKFWRIMDRGVKLPYGEFSNFARYSFTVNGVKYPTSEHYYQSKKFLDEENQKDVIACITPGEAAEMGRDPSRPLRKDWEEVKDDIMRKALLLKFQAHPKLVESLLSTGDRVLQEDSPYDFYWGIGRDGTGKNMLGVLLMELRDKLRKE